LVIGAPCGLNLTTVSAGISLTLTAVTGITVVVDDFVHAHILTEQIKHIARFWIDFFIVIYFYLLVDI
jgi:hypothetical protein